MYKQVIVIRSDLKISKGKIAVQVAHASVSVLDKINKKILDAWKKSGQKKIVVKAGSLEELKDIENKSRKLGIPSSLIADAGLTEVEPGTVTALAIGPDDEEKINKVTGKLKML